MLEAVRWMKGWCSRVVLGGGALALLAPVLAPSPVFAAPPASLDVPVAELERHGREAVQEQRFEVARDYYLDAYLRERSTARLWNLALAQLAGHDSVFALLSLRQYERAPDAEPRRKALIAQLIADAYGETGHLAFSGEATVILDGKRQDVDREVEVDVTAGDHTVSWSPSSTPMHVHAPAGKVESVELTQIPPVAIAPAMKAAPRALTTPKPSAKWPVTLGIGAGALAAAGGGLAFTILSQDRRNQAIALRTSQGLPDWFCTVNGGTSICQTAAHDMRVYSGERTASWALYGTAGALAVTATLLGVLWSPSNKESAANAWVLPTFGAGVVGAAGGASF